MYKKLMLLIIVFVIIFSVYVSPISAHEMYSYNNTPVELFWKHFDQNYMPYVAINGSSLSSAMSPYFYNEYTMWDSYNSEITITHVSSNAKLTCKTPSFTWWDEEFTFPLRSACMAKTYLWDGTGYEIENSTTAYYSDRDIGLAICRFNPYDGHDTSEPNYLSSFGATSRSHLINHEIGHALGLGHSDNYSPTTVSSLMYSVLDGSATFYAPRSHDMIDIENKYD